MGYPLTMQVLVMIAMHCIADFSMQNDFLAKYKSINNVVLGIHCIIYTAFIIAGLMICCLIRHTSIYNATSLVFIAVTFVSHFFIDYLKCRFREALEDNYELLESEKDTADTNMFYIDQMLHLVVIVILLVALNYINFNYILYLCSALYVVPVATSVMLLHLLSC